MGGLFYFFQGQRGLSVMDEQCQQDKWVGWRAELVLKQVT